MAKYVLNKVIIAIITVFVLATATFFMMKLIPGDPFASVTTKVEVQEAQRAYYGLDKPVVEQYLTYMGNLLKGDLGYSMKKTGRTVVDIIKEAFPTSAVLGLTSLFFAEVIGWTFGMLCAQYRNRWPDYVLMVFAVLGIAMPSMVIGPLMRYTFGVALKWLPVTGWGSIEQMIMPSLVLGLGTIAGGTRSMRASMLGVMTQDYVITARAKGISPIRVVMKHEFKNSLVPLVSNLGVGIAGVMMGSFVVESMFLIPGLGRYFVDSVTNLDYPLIMGLTVFYGTVLVTLNLLVDVLYGFLDPRIREATKGAAK